MSDAINDPTRASGSSDFPVAGIVGVFVAVTVLALAFVACGITRRRQLRRRAIMIENHERFYNEHHHEPSHNRNTNPILNKPLPSNKPLPPTASANPYDNTNGFGTTTNVYSNYSSGGGPPVFNKDIDINAPPPAYEPKKSTSGALAV